MKTERMRRNGEKLNKLHTTNQTVRNEMSKL